MGVRLVGIGEALWDLLPDGPQPGGAPANFAYHAHALGAQTALVTRVGNDDRGRAILSRLASTGGDQDTMQLDEVAPTGTVSIALSGEGIPSYTIHENVAWDYLAVTTSALNAVRGADAVCFGTLAQRGDISRATIQTLVGAAPMHTLRVLDINLRQHYFSREVIEQSLEVANVLKLNDAELAVLAQWLGLGGSTRHQIEALTHRFRLHLVALTRGAAGSLLFQAGEWSDCPSVPTTVVDTIGAGDAFAAALVLGMLSQWPLSVINMHADEVARQVCSQAGATPTLPHSLAERFTVRPPESGSFPTVASTRPGG
jgi:fructokinase